MTRRPRIIDLFCGAGLVHDGLVRAGFDVIGVDLFPQPRYPGPFVQADALAQSGLLRWADSVWASPPCLRHTALNTSARREEAAHGRALTDHADLIAPTRAMLQASGLPYVIENVAGARRDLRDPVTLNGFMFGLGFEVDGVRYHLKRDRLFEANWPLTAPPFVRSAPVVGVYGGHVRLRSAKHGGRGTIDFPGVTDKTALMREAMGVDRPLTGAEVSQGIPPAYAEHVGRQLIAHIQAAGLNAA